MEDHIIGRDPGALKHANQALQAELAELALRFAARTEELQKRSDRDAALAAIEPAISQPGELQWVLEHIVAVVTERLPADAASIILWDDQKHDFVISASTVPEQPPQAARDRVRRSGGATNWIMQNARALVITDIAQDPFGANPMLAAFGLRAYAGIPLLAKGRPLGVLYALDRRLRTYSDEELDFLIALANRAAVAVANVRSHMALQSANEELARASRLKDQFLANMSHELRTPLNAILGLASALQEPALGSLNDYQFQLVDTIAESGRHLLDIVNDILDFSKIEAGQFDLQADLVSAEAVCRASLQYVQHQAEAKGIALTFRSRSSVDLFMADQRLVTQVLVNLLANAVKFTSGGGEVELSLGEDAARDALCFTVRDTGIGIAEADLPRVFQPFVQLDAGLSRSYEGTGLGLSLAARLAEMHGGSLSVDSEPGKGSRFTVALPRRKPATEDSFPDGAPGPRQGVILVAEDQQLYQGALARFLEDHGFTVHTSDTVAQTLAQAQQHPPDLVIMDLLLHGEDGLEAVRHMRNEPYTYGRHLPIIALSSLDLPGERQQCLAGGASVYLVKPVGLVALWQTIETLLQPAQAQGDPS